MPRLVCLDFDGVLHLRRYWKEAIDGPPVPGAIEALIDYQRSLTVAVYSYRSATSDGRRAMINFLYQNGINFDTLQWDDALEAVAGSALGTDLQPIRFPATKPSAGVFIDDRSYPQWNGIFPTVQQLQGFDPWWKQTSGKP